MCRCRPPIFVSGGQGCRFNDADGHAFRDFNLADLSNTLGYGDTAVARIEAMIVARDLPWSVFRSGPRSGFCLTPVLPRNGAESVPSMHRGSNAARRVFMANRGVWDAICSAGPQIGFSHQNEDVDAYHQLADEFLDLET